MYRILITKDAEVATVKGEEWVTLEERPYTKEELEQQGDPEHFKDKLKSVYGYTPKVKSTKIETIKVLEQQVETLDLTAVIKAVNSID